ncbi:AlpA family phage regulatory protein [Thiothrix lacustris]|uniref:AlpA family phage regulatory protein n=1 Tax=Thiothrix lacustris TaxID=525917 RepID=A0ABY9MV59_9GAMM|nr:AlpA family phage regulatory protein [Thiothrix lacustris]WML91250.1 AlpA family phage regulatory protein [Thiothrix lacustris]
MENTKLILGFDGIKEKTKLSRWTVRRMLKRGLFPTPIRVSERLLAWDESVINAWIANGGVQQ